VGSLARLSLAAKAAMVVPRLSRDDASLRASEAMAPDELAGLQRTRAMDMARFAFRNTRFYHDLYSAAGLTGADLDDPEAFESLPVVSKSDLRRAHDDFVVPGVPMEERLPSSTGGSTGEPLTLLHDRRAPTAAMWWRVYRWWGVHASSNKAFIQRERRSPRARLRERIEWWPTAQVFLDARELTHESMTDFTRQWNRHHPELVNGYVGGVYEYAAFLRRSGLPITPPLAVGVTAAPITPSQRQFIGEVFQAPVYDQYRSAEVPWIAAQCAAQGGLHVLSDLRVVETVDDGDRVMPPGAVGDVVVTDLCNRVFPLVRYRLGDRTSVLEGGCTCALPFPRLAPIQGRISDVLRLPSGQRISGGLTGLFNAQPHAVRQFQIHQHADHSITLRCVRGSGADAVAVITRAADELAALVGRVVPVTVELVEEIRHDRGKVRVVLSDVPLSPQ
jgi:phenylacetate-CoA ligase